MFAYEIDFTVYECVRNDTWNIKKTNFSIKTHVCVLQKIL